MKKPKKVSIGIHSYYLKEVGIDSLDDIGIRVRDKEIIIEKRSEHLFGILDLIGAGDGYIPGCKLSRNSRRK